MVSEEDARSEAKRRFARRWRELSGPGVIAVTGLGSFIGRNLVDRLLAALPELRIVGLDHQRPFRMHRRVNFHRVDLTDPTVTIDALVTDLELPTITGTISTTPIPAMRFQGSGDCQIANQSALLRAPSTRI